jgi:hypothetical protein
VQYHYILERLMSYKELTVNLQDVLIYQKNNINS